MPSSTLSRLCYLPSLVLLAFIGTIPVQAGQDDLQNKYTEIKTALDKNAYDMPVYIYSSDKDHRMLGEVYGVIDYPFQARQTALSTPSHWCEIVPQHLNIKACTYQYQNGYCQLTFYTGRKYYEKADDVYQLAYRIALTDDQPEYFHVDLSAADGPMGTSDYTIQAEAIPLDETKSFIHFRYSYSYNYMTQLGMSTYLATLGRDKVGFSEIDKDAQGVPVLVNGVRGIIERNAIRYYLAIQSYLDTLRIESAQRFNARIERWFVLTENYHRQLHELDKEDYSKYKQQEFADQQRLQQLIDRKAHDLTSCNTKMAVINQ